MLYITDSLLDYIATPNIDLRNATHLEEENGDEDDDDGDDAGDDGHVEEHLVEEETGEEGDGVQEVHDRDDDGTRDDARDRPHGETRVFGVVVGRIVHVVDGGEDCVDAALGDRLQQVLVGAGAVRVQHAVDGRGWGVRHSGRLVHVRQTATAR